MLFVFSEYGIFSISFLEYEKKHINGVHSEYQLLEASKAGDLELVKKIVNLHPHIVNCRDLDGKTFFFIFFISNEKWKRNIHTLSTAEILMVIGFISQKTLTIVNIHPHIVNCRDLDGETTLPGGFISQNANKQIQISTFAIFQSCKFFRHSTPQIKVESEHCRKYSFSGRHSTPLHFAAGYNRVKLSFFFLFGRSTACSYIFSF